MAALAVDPIAIPVALHRKERGSRARGSDAGGSDGVYLDLPREAGCFLREQGFVCLSLGDVIGKGVGGDGSCGVLEELGRESVCVSGDMDWVGCEGSVDLISRGSVLGEQRALRRKLGASEWGQAGGGGGGRGGGADKVRESEVRVCFSLCLRIYASVHLRTHEVPVSVLERARASAWVRAWLRVTCT